MVTQVQSHLLRGCYNADLAATYRARFQDHPDWEIVLRFYSAVHLTQAYLLTKNARFNAIDHAGRWKAIQGATELTSGAGARFKPSYKKLKEVSEQVRYDAGFAARPQELADCRANLAMVENIVKPKIAAYLLKQTS